MPQHEQLHQIKRLIIALGCSGLLNIIFVAFLIYGLITERPPTPYFELKPISSNEVPSEMITMGNAQAIRRLRTCSFAHLLSLLNSHQMVENGYREKDLALACLITFHQLDFSRALGGEIDLLQRRQIAYGKRSNGTLAEITVYPALSAIEWQALLNFTERERWPQTPRGLFLLLKRQGDDLDPSLVDAFTLTKEFQAAEALFTRSQYQVEKIELLQMLLEGEWQLLADFFNQQRSIQDLSEGKRRQLLLNYIGKGSKIAAFLLLKTDLTFAVKKLDDANILQLLALLDEKSPDSEQFAHALLHSPRSDAVWKMAATRLSEFTGLAEQAVYQQATALMPLAAVVTNKPIKGIEKPQVIPESKKIPLKKICRHKAPPLSEKDRLYIIQEGDNLWKISRRFNIDIDLLRKHNRLSSDLLKPGAPLRIPSANRFKL